MATTTGSKRILNISADAMSADNTLTVGGNNVATVGYVDTSVSNLVSSAPETLDTLNELAAALGDDPNFATTISNSIGTKLDASVNPIKSASASNDTITFTRADDTTFTVTTSDANTNYYLNGITRSGNVLTFSVSGTTNRTYTFGSAAWAATTAFDAAGSADAVESTLTPQIGTAQTTADNAATAAATAQSAADAAQSTADDANANATAAKTDAADALTVADAALPKAGGTMSGTINMSGNALTNIYYLALGNYEKTNLPNGEGSIIYDLNDSDAPASLGDYGGSYPDGLYLRSDANEILTVYHTGHFTGTHISNWQTAYGWGNHADENYLTSFDITTQTDSKYLRSNANDTATGLVVFNGGIQVLSGTGGGQFRLKRNSGSNTGDDVFDMHMDDGNIYFDIDNDNDGDSSGFSFRYATGGSFSNLLYFNSSSISYKGNALATETFAAAEAQSVQDNLDSLSGSLGSLAALNSVAAGQIDANAVNASELNVSGNGTSGQVLTSDGDGTFSWTAKTVNTNTTYSTNTAYGTSISGTQIRMNGSELPGSINLNDYRTQGVFSQNSNSQAASGSNYPEDKAGILCVDDDMYGNGLHTAQTYYIYNSQNVYSRSYYNGSWTSWRNLAQDTNTTYSVGDGGLTQKNFTSTLKTKLDGIAANATNVTNNNQLTNGAGYITGLAFNSLTSKTSGTGDYKTTGKFRSSDNIVSGEGSGGVALTINDGYGNANLTFNHEDGVPEQNGNSARIEVNTDSTTGALMSFELASGVTSGTAIQTATAMVLYESSLEIPNYIRHVGDSDTYIKFDTNRIRLVAGNVTKFDSNTIYTGTVQSVTGTGTVSGLSLSDDGDPVDPTLTLSGTISISSANITDVAANADATPSWVPATNPNYLTSYTETDTLASVTGRGGSTTTSLSIRELTSRNIFPEADRTYILGRDDLRWQIVFCEVLDSAGLHEKNLQNPEGEKSVGDYETGTVLVWKGGKNVPCTTPADHMRMGVAVNGVSSPLVQGAEPVLCTGEVNEGDYLVTSSVEGHAAAISPQYMRQHDLFDCVLGKALESGNGDSHIIKTWVNI